MIPIFEPNLTDLEKKYLFQAYDEGWISSQGRFINKFENKFEKSEYNNGVKIYGQNKISIPSELLGKKFILPNQRFKKSWIKNWVKPIL